jgi:hypothetical protein
MNIRWWPWGLLAAACLAVLLFSCSPVVLFGNSVLDESGAYSLAAFIALARDSQFVQAFQNRCCWASWSPPARWWACPSPTWWRATNFHSRTWWPCCPS